MYVVISILFNFFQKINFTLIHFVLPKLMLCEKSQLYRFVDGEVILIQSIYKHQPLLQLRQLLIRVIQRDFLTKKKILNRLLSFFEIPVICQHPLIIGSCWEYGGFNFRYRKK